MTVQFHVAYDTLPSGHEQVLDGLKDRGIYRPNLLYRGQLIAEEEIPKVLECGTDRFLPFDQGVRRVIAQLEADGGQVIGESPETLENFANPMKLYAFIEEDLTRCIDDFAAEEESERIPHILVYDPASLIYIPSHDCNQYKGMHACDIPKVEKSGGALYQFTDPNKRSEALVALISMQELL